MISPGDMRRWMGNQWVKTLGTTDFQFRLIFCVQRISEIKFTYLDKNEPEFHKNKFQGRVKEWSSRAAAWVTEL